MKTSLWCAMGLVGILASGVAPASSTAEQTLEYLQSTCGQAGSVCEKLPPGDERELCEVNTGYVDNRTDAACGYAWQTAIDTINYLVGNGYSQVGTGTASECEGAFCVLVTVYSFYSRAAGKAATVCTAEAPGAVATAVKCGSLPTVPTAEFSAHAGIGTSLGCATGSAHFNQTKVGSVTVTAPTPLRPVAVSATACASQLSIGTPQP